MHLSPGCIGCICHVLNDKYLSTSIITIVLKAKDAIVIFSQVLKIKQKQNLTNDYIIQRPWEIKSNREKSKNSVGLLIAQNEGHFCSISSLCCFFSTYIASKICTVIWHFQSMILPNSTPDMRAKECCIEECFDQAC